MRYPSAEWRPISVNYRSGGNAPKFMIVHIMQGSLAGSDSWFRNPAAEVSAHFGVGKNGTVIQWVDTSDTAWHAMAANDCSIGVEHEGDSGDTLTAAQMEADAKLLAWATEHHAIPMQLARNPEGSGLAYHALGGANWGGHLQCPGAPIVAQLGAILKAAMAIRTDPVPAWQEALMNKLPTLQQGAADKAGQVFYVHRLQALTACFGRINGITSAAGIVESGTFDAATATAIRAVQASRKLAVDGIAGPATWSVLITGSAP